MSKVELNACIYLGMCNPLNELKSTIFSALGNDKVRLPQAPSSTGSVCDIHT